MASIPRNQRADHPATALPEDMTYKPFDLKGKVATITGGNSVSTEEWRRVMRVNLDGAFYMMRAAARHMVHGGHGGSLIVTSSSPRSRARRATSTTRRPRVPGAGFQS